MCERERATTLDMCQYIPLTETLIHSIRENILVIKATENIKSGQKITVNWHPDQENCSCDHCLQKVTTSINATHKNIY